ncbi:MAG: gluconokinase, partial [Saprospiraceae bacterium]
LAIYRQTGVPIHPMSPLLKIMWLRQNEPGLFDRVHKYLGIKEYLLFQLLGKYFSDLPVASATGLLNIRRNRWDGKALALAGITAIQLPELFPPTQVELLPPRQALAWGLPKDLPIVLGGSDGALANLGSGATEPGHWAVTIGTSAAIRMVTDTPFTDLKMRTFCYRVDETRCIVGGASNNGTNALEWLRTTVFRSRLAIGAFANQAGSISPGADGLLFLPYLLGERAPLWDAQARGSFRGLTAQHNQAHFIRAVMEGILLNLKVIAEPLEALQPLEVLHAGGGFSHSRLWVQMLADIFQKPVHLERTGIDSSVLGALQLGRLALDFPALTNKRKNLVIKPDKSKAPIYREAFARFREVCRGK